jgi:hypothetical protein
MTSITDPDHIKHFRQLTLLKGLKLELAGLKLSRGPSCYSIIKREFGLRGNRQSVYNQFSKMIETR